MKELVHRIEQLRDRLNKQLNFDKIDWGEVENLSKELDLLILEYYRKKDPKEN